MKKLAKASFYTSSPPLRQLVSTRLAGAGIKNTCHQAGILS